MTPPPSPSRRQFLGTAATTLAFAPAFAPGLLAEEKTKERRFEFCTFTKPLQHLSFAEMAKTIAAMGFDGIEGAVRPKGHVVPEKVDEDMPKLAEALKAEGLSLTVMTTSINEVSAEQQTEKILRAAAAAGVSRYRMGYYKYDLGKPIRAQLDEFRPKLKDLIALSRELGIKPIYQNHSGKDYFGGPIWDLAEVLSDHDPAEVGVAFDIGHATVEGAKAWPLNFALIRPYLDTVYVKEPSWKDNVLGWGPLGEGAVDKGFFKLLQESDFSGPVSLHVEYLGHDDPSQVPTVLAAIEKDFATLKGLLS
ncbi:MAG: sugar phosphate isomerase/epimerase [Verrucomicrobiales bacterium]|nr:sugar phosphate isomerase/epimerase [Verrucomicrobiales bacterium]